MYRYEEWLKDIENNLMKDIADVDIVHLLSLESDTNEITITSPDEIVLYKISAGKSVLNIYGGLCNIINLISITIFDIQSLSHILPFGMSSKYSINIHESFSTELLEEEIDKILFELTIQYGDLEPYVVENICSLFLLHKKYSHLIPDDLYLRVEVL